MKKLLTTTCILGVSLGVYTDSAHAYGFKKLNITDTDFQTKVSTGEWTESWVAQARIGDAASGSPNKTYEVNLQDITTACNGGSCTQTFETPIPTSAQSNFQWQSGKSYDFNLDFNATADPDANAANGVGNASFTFTGNNPPPAQTTTVTINDLMDGGEKINSLLVRVVAPTNGNSSVTIGDKLDISDDGFTDLASYGDKLIANSGSNPRDVKYLQITGINGDFHLDGQTIFQWAGITDLPKDSQLAFQVKGVFIPETGESEVPEPATISLLSLGFLAAVGSRVRRPSAQ
jgi:PEP-CTERM motif